MLADILFCFNNNCALHTKFIKIGTTCVLYKIREHKGQQI